MLSYYKGNIPIISDDPGTAAIERPAGAMFGCIPRDYSVQPADTFRAFFVAIDEQSSRNFGFLPHSFELSDRCVASLLSCALGLGPDEAVDAPYVKRLRQRQRERAVQS